MLAQIGVNRFSFLYSNHAAPTLTPGTSVVPGASNVEGSFTQVASGANIAQDIYQVNLWVCIGATVTNSKQHLLDIGIDPAGGTSYTTIPISNIVCGNSLGLTGPSAIAGLFFQFPIFISAGSSVAVRIQGSNATAGTVRVAVDFFGQPSHPEMIRVGQYSETIGAITNSSGVAFTPGNSGAEGTWVSLGTTTRALWWWQLCCQCDNAAQANLVYAMDLAVGDGTSQKIIIENLPMFTTTGEATSSTFAAGCFCGVPAGAELWVRGSCSGTTDTGWNAVAVGVGG